MKDPVQNWRGSSSALNSVLNCSIYKSNFIQWWKNSMAQVINCSDTVKMEPYHVVVLGNNGVAVVAIHFCRKLETNI